MLARRIHAARMIAAALSFAGAMGMGGGTASAAQECAMPRIEWLRYDDAATVETPPAPGNTAPDNTNGLLVAGVGAIAGVVAFNMATGGTAALPFLASSGTAPLLSASEGAIAVSRVYAVTSAVAGALVADWLFRPSQEQRIRPVPSRLAARLAM
ncbi:MAG: hypothetical protein HQL34_09465 [Alphaproteobacteria bacterium]|nr:hypothetical protein [Alphaproteobacteria bacterium]